MCYLSISIIFFLIKLEIITNFDHNVTFNYNSSSDLGPSNWAKVNPECAGNKQSPIVLDINFAKNITYSQLLTWSREYVSIPPRRTTLQNLGNKFQLNTIYFNTSVPYLSGGPISGVYYMQSLHFHWGENDDGKGSEHFLYNTSWPIEMHVVHTQQNENETSYAVLAYFFKISEEDNPAIAKFMDGTFPSADDEMLIHGFPVKELVKPFTSKYLTYNGSLTTPPCSETVTWIISTDILKISARQMSYFRNVSANTLNLKNNYRDLQQINERVIYFVN